MSLQSLHRSAGVENGSENVSVIGNGTVTVTLPGYASFSALELLFPSSPSLLPRILVFLSSPLLSFPCTVLDAGCGAWGVSSFSLQF